MKTTLTFESDELDQADMAFKGAEAHYALLAIDNMCRNWVKHYDLSEEEIKRLEEIREQCREFVMN